MIDFIVINDDLRNISLSLFFLSRINKIKIILWMNPEYNIRGTVDNDNLLLIIIDHGKIY